ncbi:ABC transporter permease [Listeria monocytogenes]|nr:ABC transporter permease [Listeria monocytogenes]
MTYALEIKGLRKIYSTGVEALRGVDLTVEEGDFYALLGPNGAGKSTTIGIITSLVNKTSGQVSVFGYDLDTDIVRAKQQIGLVPQEFNFNPFETVQQIVVNQAGYYGVSRKEAIKRSEKYLKQSNLWEKRNERARMLSGGMKRRLMIARALMHEPKLLILDEPTAGVDIELRREMWTFLRELNESGTTIILTTHYLEEAEMLCRNIGIIQSGELIENTSMKSLLSKLQFETFIFDLEPYEEAFEITGYNHVFEDKQTLSVEVERNQGVNHIFEQLSEHGIKVLSMRNKSNRYMRIWVQTLVPPVITTSLYFIIFGKMIGSRIGEMNGFSYMEYIVPGLIMMSVITSSYANVSSSFFSQKFQKNIEEILVAPVPTHIIIWGFLIGGIGRSVLVGALVTLISMVFVPIHIHSWTIGIITFLMTAILFSLAGLINGIFARSFDDVSIVPTFVLQPLTYLGGVFYAISMLPPIWQAISKVNPIVYMISGFRYGFLGVTDVPVAISLSILVVFSAVLYSICWYLISKGRGLRS